MSHFEQEITEKQDGWQVETRDAGTCYIPGDVVPIPIWLRIGATLFHCDAGKEGSAIFDALSSRLHAYVEGHDIESITAVHGYFARWSAPGYLDCTAWGCYSTLKEARAALRDE